MKMENMEQKHTISIREPSPIAIEAGIGIWWNTAKGCDLKSV